MENFAMGLLGASGLATWLARTTPGHDSSNVTNNGTKKDLFSAVRETVTGVPTETVSEDPRISKYSGLISAALAQGDQGFWKLQRLLHQIEQDGLTAVVPNVPDAKKVLGSLKNGNDVQIDATASVSSGARYLPSEQIPSFVHNNFVPFFKGSKTHDMTGTGVPEGNYSRAQNTNKQTVLDTYSGVDGLNWKSRTERNPESAVFSPTERGMDNVFGNPVTRPNLDRYLDPQTKRHDMKPVEAVRVGPGLNIPAHQSVRNVGGYHDMYRIPDEYNPINSKVRHALEMPEPLIQAHQTAGGLATSVAFAPGLVPDSGQNTKEGYSNFDPNENKLSGKGYISRKCNVEITTNNRTPIASTGPRNPHMTGDDTQYLHRGVGKRDQSQPYVGNERPDTGKHEQNFDKTAYNNNVRLLGTDRDKQIPIGGGHGFYKGPAQANEYYINKRDVADQGIPVANYRDPSVLSSSKFSHSAKPTMRGQESDVIKGSRPSHGHSKYEGYSAKTTTRETAQSGIFGVNERGPAPKAMVVQKEVSQRNNNRALLIPESHVVIEGNKSQADLKTRVGGYKLSTPLDTEIRPMEHTKNFNQTSNHRGTVTVRDTKVLHVEATPGVNIGFRGNDKIYTTRPMDSRDNCKEVGASQRMMRGNVTDPKPLDLYLSNEERRSMALRA